MFPLHIFSQSSCSEDAKLGIWSSSPDEKAGPLCTLTYCQSASPLLLLDNEDVTSTQQPPQSLLMELATECQSSSWVWRPDSNQDNGAISFFSLFSMELLNSFAFTTTIKPSCVTLRGRRTRACAWQRGGEERVSDRGRGRRGVDERDMQERQKERLEGK